MRVLPLTIIAVVLTAAVAAQAQFTYSTNNGSATITGYSGPGGLVVIPTNVDYQMIVTGIGDEVFYYRYDVTGIVIPDTVTNVGQYTFYNCGNLTSITLPTNLASIGNYAFEGCGSLTNLSLPAGVTSIGTGAFGYCSGLTGITLSGSMTTIGYSEFLNCTGLTNVVIPNGVTSIGEYAFSGCSRLRNSSIPGSVTNIGYGAFFGCTGLTNVNIPNSVASIGQYAFYSCPNLSSVCFNGNVPHGDPTVFAGDHATAFYMPGTHGWGQAFGGISTALTPLPSPVILMNNDPNFGVQNGQFGFTIAWATNSPVVIQACANFANPVWVPVATNTCINGFSYFTDANSTNNPCCFYRVVPNGP